IIKITSVSLVLLVILAAAVFYMMSRGLFNCLTIGESYQFVETGSNIYISKGTPEGLKDSILSVLKESEKRVCSFWNEDKLEKKPVRIFCNSKSLLSDYAGKNSIMTYKTPLNSFTVFSKDCINLDMLSHELFHAEFCSRLGYFKNKKIPVWFDEGLAMQVDYRKEYSEDKFNELKDSSGMNINLNDISAPEKFYSGNYYYHFVLARHAVSAWLNKVKKEGFEEFINRIKNGEDFHSIVKI
ncbi:MAG TPA: hypothetical protein VMT35_13025, partial [Ignavibacteriaceae bacterium]|nr:hypothetical protein [Ignavibacteriaceae bacterium]